MSGKIQGRSLVDLECDTGREFNGKLYYSMIGAFSLVKLMVKLTKSIYLTLLLAKAILVLYLYESFSIISERDFLVERAYITMLRQYAISCAVFKLVLSPIICCAIRLEGLDNHLLYHLIQTSLMSNFDVLLRYY